MRHNIVCTENRAKWHIQWIWIVAKNVYKMYRHICTWLFYFVCFHYIRQCGALIKQLIFSQIVTKYSPGNDCAISCYIGPYHNGTWLYVRCVYFTHFFQGWFNTPWLSCDFPSASQLILRIMCKMEFLSNPQHNKVWTMYIIIVNVPWWRHQMDTFSA